jgi:hypothetical protein
MLAVRGPAHRLVLHRVSETFGTDPCRSVPTAPRQP